MSRLALLDEFLSASRKVRTPDDLHRVMQDVTREIGFDHFALVHHVDLRPNGSMVDHVVTDDFAVLSDYPQFWIDQYIAGTVVANDPVLVASQKTSTGFWWDEISDLINLTNAQRDILENGVRAGLGNGFTVPAHVPGELFGSCNFAVAAGKDPPRENFALAQLIGSHAFNAARQMVGRLRKAGEFAPVKLTDRQIECLVLVARGKTDWEIGQILGISHMTVRDHLKDARQRYDVTKTVQVLMRAVFDEQIPLTDVLA